ncbi:MAG TPA: glycosyltransferase family 9 protein [Woeseiaceae bacterium]|nr:glycosyltransferase family 9 protein [Woeseiaceae bacterium]
MFQQSPPESLCVIRLSAIGDTCHALAVVRAIQDTWPETRLTWIIGRTEAALMADIPGIEFITFDKSNGTTAYRDVRAQLRDRRFDAALCMHASMRANILSLLVPSAVRLGYDRERAKDFQWLFTNRRIEPRERQHAQDAMLEFASAIGAPRRRLRWDIPLSSSHREFAAQYQRDGRPLFVVSPCSSQRSRNFRNWSAENYAAAANHARQKFGCRIVLTGGNSEIEREYGSTIGKLCGPDIVNLIGRTSLKQLLALLDAAAALLCPDSGPAHMATTVRTPVIGLYATSNPDRTGPYLSRNLTVNAYPEAARRFLGKSVDELRWGQRVRDPRAMSLIRVASVNAQIDRLFDTGRCSTVIAEDRRNMGDFKSAPSGH